MEAQTLLNCSSERKAVGFSGARESFLQIVPVGLDCEAHRLFRSFQKLFCTKEKELMSPQGIYFDIVHTLNSILQEIGNSVIFLIH